MNGTRPTTSVITSRDRLDHFLARWSVRRYSHRVEPGLYALGEPGEVSPVFVTANYTLSFDALRSALAGMDAYILVLETNGINVWCAAGKGTFGTDELVGRIEATGLASVVSHRNLILPQLGAAGVSAHEVRDRSGFRVRYGPVRAADLPGYVDTGDATREMRRVRFDIRDRVVLIPVELVHVFLPALAAAVGLFFAGGWLSAGAAVAAVLAGTVVFPVVLPFVPTRDFSSKGFILGFVVALAFVAAFLARHHDAGGWEQLGGSLVYLLAMPPVTAFLALNFTGSTPVASRSGVRREIFRYLPAMAALFGAGIILAIVLAIAS